VSIGKIILASFAAIIAIEIIAFAATLTVADVEINTELIAEPKQEETEPISTPQDPQITTKTITEDPPKYIPKEKQCAGNARCISGFVGRIIDGDTIVVGDKSIRFALANTPEWGDYDYTQAGAYIEAICPVGSKVLVDEDDGQTEGSHGRIIAKIYCNELILNEEILEVGHAVLLTEFCGKSEFTEEPWAQKHGCAETIESTIPANTKIKDNCDPSYPDVCISSPPPDLDCGKILYQNFRVLPADPHGFDGDKDGIGCES
jgi:micrococcal nuclease